MPPLTGRIYDRSRLEGNVVNSHSFDNREESIYGLLASRPCLTFTTAWQ
jgi:hypothetical protein